MDILEIVQDSSAEVLLFFEAFYEGTSKNRIFKNTWSMTKILVPGERRSKFQNIDIVFSDPRSSFHYVPEL